jgi:hypothetical protein
MSTPPAYSIAPVKRLQRFKVSVDEVPRDLDTKNISRPPFGDSERAKRYTRFLLDLGLVPSARWVALLSVKSQATLAKFQFKGKLK